MNKQSRKDIESLIMAALVGCCIFGIAHSVKSSEIIAVLVYSVFMVICVGFYALQEWETTS
jgi:FtsH-binding integral membrane protein